MEFFFSGFSFFLPLLLLAHKKGNKQNKKNIRYVVCRQGAAAASAAALAAGSDPAAAAKAGAEAALAAISALPRPLSSNSQELHQQQQQQQQQRQAQAQGLQSSSSSNNNNNNNNTRPSGPCFGSPVAPGAATSTLVVSEFVGCSPSLSGAIRVNPWSVDAVADGLYSAITLPRAEAALRHDKHWRLEEDDFFFKPFFFFFVFFFPFISLSLTTSPSKLKKKQ